MWKNSIGPTRECVYSEKRVAAALWKNIREIKREKRALCFASASSVVG